MKRKRRLLLVAWDLKGLNLKLVSFNFDFFNSLIHK
jgi:hypothetical protein